MSKEHELPDYNISEWFPKKSKYCFVAVTWNEGERFINQIKKMEEKSDEADIIISDRRSNDGSTSQDFLINNKVRALLETDAPGRCTSIRIAIDYAMNQNYQGIIFVDGNGKDGVDALPNFIESLDNGYDLVQGSRFIKGGYHTNTPLARYLGIKLVVSPFLSLGTGFFFTDPTNGFRACSMKYINDPRLKPLRKIFVWENLQLYLIWRAAQLNLKIKEIPESRVYPDDGTVPTKVVGLKYIFRFLWEMVLTKVGTYNPK